MLKGTVKSWNEKSGLGYITSDQVSEDVFVHFSGITNDDGRRSLQIGDAVNFVVVEGIRGLQAAKVRIIGED